MSNDDNTLGAVLTLAVGGAAGYAAGRWIVEPWLASRTSQSAPARRQAITGEPVDPYADPVAASSSPVQTDGPITSPSQVDPTLAQPTTAPIVTAPSQPATSTSAPAVAAPSLPAPPPSSSGKFATSAGVRRFDAVFDRYRGSIPREYVRALVDRESDGRPSVQSGSAVGLMQIVPVVLTDYNKRHGTTYQSEQLVDPAINVAMGCEVLRIIVENYRKFHPRIPNFQTDWNNPHFVELLTFGWNAGFSEAGGVGRVARYLEQLGAVDITLDLITAHARVAGASKHLSNPAKVAWCKSVVALYQRERALANPPITLVA